MPRQEELKSWQKREHFLLGQEENGNDKMKASNYKRNEEIFTSQPKGKIALRRCCQFQRGWGCLWGCGKSSENSSFLLSRPRSAKEKVIKCKQEKKIANEMSRVLRAFPWREGQWAWVEKWAEKKQ